MAPNVIRAAPQLVDHLGRPIVREVLTREVAGPTVAGVRSIISGHPASGLTPQRLAGILRSAESGDATNYLELAEEMEEKDLHYVSVLGTRKRQVSQLEVTIEAATDDQEDQDNAELCRDWLDRDTLEDDVFDILDAVGKGVSLCEIVWDVSERQWWPARLEFVLPQWLQFDRVDGKTLRLKDGSADGAELEPFKYVQHRMKAKSGLTIRGGLARPVSWAWMFKNYAVKDWVAFAEVYGMPLRLGKYEPGASEADKSTLLQAVTDISSDAAAIIPKSMEISFEGGQSQADGELFQQAADWFDKQIARAVLGQDGTTAMQSGGGYAQSKTLDGVREDIEQADAKLLAATLRRDIFAPMIDLNRGRPKSGKYPRVAIGRAESWDPEKMMPAVERFVRMGGRVGMSFIRDRIGVEDPAPDEEVLRPPSEAAPAAADPADPAAGAPPPKKSPRTADPANDATKPPEDGKRAARALLGLLTAAAAAGGGPAPDAIDQFVEDGLGDWEALISPMVAPIEALLAGATDLEDARERLGEALAGMDAAALAELLARAGFNARLAGLSGLDLT